MKVIPGSSAHRQKQEYEPVSHPGENLKSLSRICDKCCEEELEI